MTTTENLLAFIHDIPDLKKSKGGTKNRIWTSQLREFLEQFMLSQSDLYQLNEIIGGLTAYPSFDSKYEDADLFLRLLMRKDLTVKPKPGITPKSTPQNTEPLKEIVTRIIKARDETQPKRITQTMEGIRDTATPKIPTIQNIKSNKIFIVHGHDDASKLELARMIEKMGLEAIILHEKPNEGKTIIEKFEAHSKDVNFAFVLLTPDDLGGKDKDHLNKRARQNVILELGFFIGRLGRSSVCCLHKSEVEVPTDYSGVTFLPFKESIRECHEDIIRELKTAGYNLKI